jgi:hypothetical protein
MKKFLAIAAIAVLALASCTNLEVIENSGSTSPIGFGTYSHLSTKATIADIKSLQETGFGTYSYKLADNTYSSFMTNLQVKTAEWTYSPIMYWPDPTETLDFYFYAPYYTTANSNISFVKAQSESYHKLLYTFQTEIEKQSDLMWGLPRTGCTRDTDNGFDGTARVKAEFNHGLSRLGLTSKTALDTSKFTVNIKNIVIRSNFYKQGTFDYSDGTWDLNAADTVGLRNYIPGLQDDTTLDNDWKTINDFDQYVMVIPGGVTDITFEIEFEVITIIGYDEETGEPITQTNTYTAEATIPIDLEPGKAYTITLDVTLDTLRPIEFGAIVNGWDVENISVGGLNFNAQ